MSSLMFLFGKMGRVEFKYGHQTDPISVHIKKRRTKKKRERKTTSENQKIVPLLTIGSHQRRNVRKVPLGSSSKFNFRIFISPHLLIELAVYGSLKGNSPDYSDI